MTSAIFAARGEWIRCENGHKICCAAHDLRYGDMQHPLMDWTDWQQPMPPVGAQPEDVKCSVCKAPWFRGGSEFHFSDGWRK